MKSVFKLAGLFLLILLISFVFSCKKDNPSPPVLGTTVVSEITYTTAVSGGSITNDGGTEVISKGICWDTSDNPTISNNKTTEGSGSDAFTSNLTQLTPNTLYYVRAYATNTGGTGYGNQQTFTTVSTVVRDVEGNSYNIVIIGDQIWMRENLKVTKLNDGTSITTNLTDSEWSNITAPAYCWPDGSSGYKDVYGGLYNWYTINTGKLCPEGWHVPNNDEWSTLIMYAGGTQTGGNKLKESGTNHWGSSNTGATNETGFTALPAGERHSDGYIFGPGGLGLWWSSTEFDNLNGMMWYIYSDMPVVSLGPNFKPSGISVRCIKN